MMMSTPSPPSARRQVLTPPRNASTTWSPHHSGADVSPSVHQPQMASPARYAHLKRVAGRTLRTPDARTGSEGATSPSMAAVGGSPHTMGPSPAPARTAATPPSPSVPEGLVVRPAPRRHVDTDERTPTTATREQQQEHRPQPSETLASPGSAVRQPPAQPLRPPDVPIAREAIDEGTAAQAINAGMPVVVQPPFTTYPRAAGERAAELDRRHPDFKLVSRDAIHVGAAATAAAEARGSMPIGLRRTTHISAAARDVDAVVAVGHIDGLVSLIGLTGYPRNTMVCLRSWTTLHSAAVTAVALHDGYLLTGDDAGVVRLTDPERHSVIFTTNVKRSVTSVALTRGLFAAGTQEGVIFVFSTRRFDVPVEKYTCDDDAPVLSVSIDVRTGDLLYAQPAGLFARRINDRGPARAVVRLPSQNLRAVYLDEADPFSGVFMSSSGVFFPFSADDAFRPHGGAQDILDRGVLVDDARHATLLAKGTIIVQTDAGYYVVARSGNRMAAPRRLPIIDPDQYGRVPQLLASATPCWLLCLNHMTSSLEGVELHT